MREPPSLPRGRLAATRAVSPPRGAWAPRLGVEGGRVTCRVSWRGGHVPRLRGTVQSGVTAVAVCQELAGWMPWLVTTGQ